MESFHWNDRFLTGLPEVDEQHRTLVNLINRLGESLAAERGSGEADLDQVLDELTDYTRFHFTGEEDLMVRVGVDERHLSLHRKLHHEFVTQLVEARTEVGTHAPGETQRIMKLLVRWLGNHILGTDRVMGLQIRAIERGASPAEAYQATVARDGDEDRVAEPLVDALNDLYSEVASRNRELLALNQSLERKVAQRTEELAKANRQLEAMAMTDALTGLPNRRHAMAAIERLWEESARRGRPVSCMLIDADGFKQINDRHGHDAGDEVLRKLATELRDSSRSDDVVARLGGDEFLVLLPATDLPGALEFAERTRRAVDRMRVPAGGGEWKGSISVGVASRTDGMASPEALIKAADDGTYLAKKRGRNCVASAQEALAAGAGSPGPVT